MGSNFQYSSTKFEQSKILYKETLEWLDSLGVFWRNTRLSMHLQVIEGLVESRANDTLSDFVRKHSVEEVAHHLYEINTLHLVCETFKGKESDGLLRKLKIATEGPIFPKDEDENSNHARNTLFELEVASLLINSGYKISIDQREDIFFYADGEKITVECKRLQNESRLEKNVKKALEQLKQSYLEGRSEKGMICFSVGKALNQGFLSLIKENPEEIHRTTTRICSQVSKKVEEIIEKKPKRWHNKNLGWAIMLNMPCVTENLDKIVNVRQLLILAMNNEEKNRLILQDWGDRIVKCFNN
jgi:hypothetical protein